MVEYKPLSFAWEITMGCNMRCKHCGSSCEDQLRGELSTEQAMAVCDKLKELGVKLVTLTGGEPTIREDWLLIMVRLKENGIYPTIISNGWLVNEQLADQFVAAGLRDFAISIDGMKDSHDFIRRTGSFERILKAITVLRQKDIRIAINTTINNRNIKELPQMKLLLKELGVTYWQLQFAMPMGTFHLNQDDLMIAPEQIDEIIDFAYENMDDDLKIYLGDCIGYYNAKEATVRNRTAGETDWIWSGCSAGKYTMGILHNGDIVGCTSIRGKEFIEGNILTDDIHEIWANGFSWNRNLKKADLPGFCGECAYGDMCLGGCASSRYCTGGSIKSENLFCSYRNFVFAEAKKAPTADEKPGAIHDYIMKLLESRSYNVLVNYLLKMLETPKDSSALNEIYFLNHLHFAYFQLEEYQKSLRICEEVLAKDQDNTYGIHGIILNLIMANQLEEAGAYLLRLKDLASDLYEATLADTEGLLTNDDQFKVLQSLGIPIKQAS